MKTITLSDFLDHQIREDMILAVMSGQRHPDGPSKIKIRPIELKGSICYQASSVFGPKEVHKNYEKEELLSRLIKALGQDFSQLQIQGQSCDGSVLVSKKGKMTIRQKRHENTGSAPNLQILAHNRVKNYILKEGTPVPFLVDLGVMNPAGKVIAARYDKFRQINRFLEFIEDILPELPKDREVTILDFGCGKSYLTFAMYYYLKELRGIPVRIIGLDLKADVIKNCRELAESYGYEHLQFLEGDIADYEGVSSVDMVVTLHACDTATDHALAKAVGWGARVILSVPCCQHEINRQLKNEMLSPVLKYGILKERMSALLTDGIRAELLESKGYDTQLLEFIDMEHTPKNLLIRAVKRETGSCGSRPEHTRKLDFMMKELHVEPTLKKLLE